MRSCTNTALRALVCASGVAIAGSAIAANGATPEALSAQTFVPATGGDAAFANAEPSKLSVANLRGPGRDDSADRFGLRVPAFPGTVCDAELDWCFAIDGASSDFLYFADAFEVIDSIFLVSGDTNTGTVDVNQICFGAVWSINSSNLAANDPNNPFNTNFRFNIYPSDGFSQPGTNFPDTSAPVVRFVETLTGDPTEVQLPPANIEVTYGAIGGIYTQPIDLFKITFPQPVILDADTCYWLGIQSDDTGLPAPTARILPAIGENVDGSLFQDSNQNGTFEQGERNEGDLGWCIYGADVLNPQGPEDDYFLGFGDPNLGEACYVNVCPPEATNLTCDTATELTVGNITASGGLCNVSLGVAGDEALNCPIFINGIDDITLARGVWFTVVGDGTTYTVSTNFLTAGNIPDTAINLYCNAADAPGTPDCSILYCLAADSDFAGNGADLPAEFSWATTQDEVYYLLVHQSNADEFQIEVTSDFVSGACDTFNCAPIIIDCPTGSNLDELVLEPCDDAQPESGNSGCNAATPTTSSFAPLVTDQIICGTMNRVGGGSDLDWYSFTLTQPSIVDASLLAEQPAALLIFDLSNKDDGNGGTDPTGCTALLAGTTGSVNQGPEESFAERGTVNDLQVALPAGDYAVVPRPTFGAGYEYSCAGFETDYQLLVTIDAVAPVPSGGTVEIGGVPGNRLCTTSTATSGFRSDPNRGCFSGDAAGSNSITGNGDYRGQSGINDDGIVDADAWEVTLASEQLVTIELVSQFPARIGIFEKVAGVCDAFFFTSDRFSLPANDGGTFQRVLPAGTYQFIITPEENDEAGLFAAAYCDDGIANEYFFTYTAQAPCVISAPMGAIAETEDWCANGESNSGCDAAPDACTPAPGTASYAGILSVGDTASGSIGAEADLSAGAGTASRDIDEWQFTTTSQQTLTIELDAAFPVDLALLDVADCNNIGVVGTSRLFADCSGNTATIEFTDLPAGTYAVQITTAFGAVDCAGNSGGYDYYFTLGGGAAPCPADLTTTGSANGIPDGVADLSDFSFYLTLWSNSDPQADITTTGSANGIPDGTVDLSDFSLYLTLWSAGCP